jgi:signal transduction histidine kinase
MTVFKNLSIKNKLIVIQTVTAFIVVLVCCIFFVTNDIRTFKESAGRKIYSLARIAGENALSTLVFMDQDAATQILSKLNKEPDIVEGTILDKKGKLFARYSRVQPEKEPIDDTASYKPASTRLLEKKLSVNYQLYQDKEFLGTVILHAELNDLDKIIYDYVKVTALVLLTAILASFLIALILQHSIVHRLLQLVSKTKQVAETGNYSLRTYDKGADEIGILSGGFNTMLEQIEKMDRHLKESNFSLQSYSQSLERSNKELEEFAYISSHDMKSPMTSLLGMLTLMQQRDAIKKEHRNLFDLAINSAMQMQKTIKALNEIIAFRKTLTIKREKIDLAEALQEVKLSIHDMIISSGAVISVDFSNCPYINYPPVHLKSIFQNLLTNAIKYKQEGKPPVIDIKTTHKDNFVVLEFSDQGMGIDMKRNKEKLYGLFQRFHANIEGVGIGLHMIHSIIVSYGGKIEVESEVNRGTTFKINLNNAPI